MKKINKLIISLCIVALSICMLIVGVWASSGIAYKISGIVSYETKDYELFFRIDGTASGIYNTDDTERAITPFSFVKDNNETDTVDDWTIGEDLYFGKVYESNTLTIPDIEIQITVTNIGDVPVFVKNAWGNSTDYDTSLSQSSNAKIRLAFYQKSVTSSSWSEYSQGSYVSLLNNGDAVNFKVVLKLKDVYSDIALASALAFSWNFVFFGIFYFFSK